jgi:GntR family transcriptional regulator
MLHRKDKVNDLKMNKIDKSSFVPPFYQLATILEKRIYSGEFKPGDPLPSETDLGKEYELSRMTVRKCLNLLAERGLIVAQQGRGTFVSRPCLDRATFVLEDFKEELGRRGLEPGYRLVHVRLLKATDEIGVKLQVQHDDRILYYCRLLLGNHEPLAVEHKYMRYVKGKPILENELQYKAFSEVISLNTDILPVRSRMTLCAASAEVEEAQLLNAAVGLPVLKVEQSLYSQDGNIVGIGIFYYHGERYSLVSDIQPLKGEG